MWRSTFNCGVTKAAVCFQISLDQVQHVSHMWSPLLGSADSYLEINFLPRSSDQWEMAASQSVCQSFLHLFLRSENMSTNNMQCSMRTSYCFAYLNVLKLFIYKIKCHLNLLFPPFIWKVFINKKIRNWYQAMLKPDAKFLQYFYFYFYWLKVCQKE